MTRKYSEDYKRYENIPKDTAPHDKATESIALTDEEHDEWPPLQPKPTSRYVILRGINNYCIADRIFQPYPLPGTNEMDPTKNKAGRVLYAIVGFADSIAEAKNIFLGLAHRAKGPQSRDE